MRRLYQDWARLSDGLIDQRRRHDLVGVAEPELRPADAHLDAGKHIDRAANASLVRDEAVHRSELLDAQRPTTIDCDPRVLRVDIGVIEDEVVPRRTAERQRQRIESLPAARPIRVFDLEDQRHAMRSR